MSELGGDHVDPNFSFKSSLCNKPDVNLNLSWAELAEFLTILLILLPVCIPFFYFKHAT